jgi:transposase
MGKKNKIVKLTPQKIRYIIRYKTNNNSTKSIAKDLKISESTVKRVWMHWIRTKTPLNISKFGRKKKEMDKATEELILRITLISISESFDVVEASTKSKISAQGVWKRS